MRKHTKDLALIAFMSIFIAICSWIAIPMVVSFTLQTFAIFFTLRLLGGKKGLIAIALYIILGLIGVPVFSGFKSGFATLIGPTGGYIWGFLACALIYLAFEKFLDNKIVLYIVMFSGLTICYLIGTIWFVFVMSNNGDNFTFAQALLVCVVPFIIPDIVKIIGANLLSQKILNTLFQKNELITK